MSKLSFEMMALKFKKRYKKNLILPILEEAGIKEGDSILDFGCGPGGYAVQAAKMVGDSGNVNALDIQPQAEKHLRKYAEQDSVANVKYICSDCNTNLEEDSIDVVLFYDTYHMLSDKEKVLNELNRIMKKDGIMSFSDHHMKDEDITREIEDSGLFELVEKYKNTHKFKKK